MEEEKKVFKIWLDTLLSRNYTLLTTVKLKCSFFTEILPKFWLEGVGEKPDYITDDVHTKLYNQLLLDYSIF